MSRVGKNPVAIPSGVEVSQASGVLTVKGPKGSLTLSIRPEVCVRVEGSSVLVERTGTGPERFAGAMHGTTRAHIANMMTGVTQGFRKRLEIIGVGWNAKAGGKNLTLNIGFCLPQELKVPEGLTVETPTPNQIILTGSDCQKVGQFAAEIRKMRPPEPYKGKGIRYEGEFVRRKSGKSFGS